MQTFKTRYTKLINDMNLTVAQKDIIKCRYLGIVTSAERSCWLTNISYLVLTNVVTIAAVLIASFVSFNKLSSGSCQQLCNDTTISAFLWVVWVLGIVATLANNWLYVFNIPKKYVLNIAALEKLYSEGWSFAAKIGKYAIDDPVERFQLFCARVEKIKMKAIESMPELQNNDVADLLATGAYFNEAEDISITSADVSIDGGNDDNDKNNNHHTKNILNKRVEFNKHNLQLRTQHSPHHNPQHNENHNEPHNKTHNELEDNIEMDNVDGADNPNDTTTPKSIQARSRRSQKNPPNSVVVNMDGANDTIHTNEKAPK
jgi:hypothetical protein